MSKDSMAKFWKQVESDEQLQQELDALFQQRGGSRVVTGAAIVEVATKRGFEFTADELKADLASGGRGSELSEQDLEAVAGGYTYYKVTFGDLVISSFQTGGTAFKPFAKGGHIVF